MTSVQKAMFWVRAIIFGLLLSAVTFFSFANVLNKGTEPNDILFSLFGFTSYLVILAELSTI
jgi:hypothetical protein